MSHRMMTLLPCSRPLGRRQHMPTSTCLRPPPPWETIPTTARRCKSTKTCGSQYQVPEDDCATFLTLFCVGLRRSRLHLRPIHCLFQRFSNLIHYQLLLRKRSTLSRIPRGRVLPAQRRSRAGPPRPSARNLEALHRRRALHRTHSGPQDHFGYRHRHGHLGNRCLREVSQRYRHRHRSLPHPARLCPPKYQVLRG